MVIYIQVLEIVEIEYSEQNNLIFIENMKNLEMFKFFQVLVFFKLSSIIKKVILW